MLPGRSLPIRHARARRGRILFRATAAVGVVALLLTSSMQVFAHGSSSMPTLSVSAAVKGTTTVLAYEVRTGASSIRKVSCLLTYPNGSKSAACDTTPDWGSSSKVTKYGFTASTPQFGKYTFLVKVELKKGGSVSKSISFTIAPPKPPQPPTPPKPAFSVKVGTAVSGFSTTFTYEVGVGASSIKKVECKLTLPNGSTNTTCDTSPNFGSSSKVTKYSFTLPTTIAGQYSFELKVTLKNGKSVTTTKSFTVQPGPAVRFSVAGLVRQDVICFVETGVCNKNLPDFPRQIATIKALDAMGNVATGYAGTISFKSPLGNITPTGLSDMQLTNGVGYAPVFTPSLPTALSSADRAVAEQYCPGQTVSLKIYLIVTDTVDPSIFGCQAIDGGFEYLILPPPPYVPPPPEAICVIGCIIDPTQTITIDTNAAAPQPLTETIAGDQSLVITGVTASNYYFTQPVTLGPLSIIGASIPADSLALCALCTPDLNYLGSQVVDATSGLLISGSTIQTDTIVVMPWEPPDDPSSGTPVTVGTFITGAGTPTCYADSQLQIVVGAESCA